MYSLMRILYAASGEELNPKLIKWIDRLEADFEKRKQYPNEKSRLRVLRELDDARNVYRNIVSQSANH